MFTGPTNNNQNHDHTQLFTAIAEQANPDAIKQAQDYQKQLELKEQQERTRRIENEVRLRAEQTGQR